MGAKNQWEIHPKLVGDLPWTRSWGRSPWDVANSYSSPNFKIQCRLQIWQISEAYAGSDFSQCPYLCGVQNVSTCQMIPHLTGQLSNFFATNTGPIRVVSMGRGYRQVLMRTQALGTTAYRQAPPKPIVSELVKLLTCYSCFRLYLSQLAAFLA